MLLAPKPSGSVTTPNSLALLNSGMNWSWNGHLTELEGVTEQTYRMLQHVYGLGIAQGLTMQASKIVSQAGVLAFYPSHIGFADDLVTVWDELRINRITIRHPEATGPALDSVSQGRKGGCTVVTDDPI